MNRRTMSPPTNDGGYNSTVRVLACEAENMGSNPITHPKTLSKGNLCGL